MLSRYDEKYTPLLALLLALLVHFLFGLVLFVIPQRKSSFKKQNVVSVRVVRERETSMNMAREKQVESPEKTKVKRRVERKILPRKKKKVRKKVERKIRKVVDLRKMKRTSRKPPPSYSKKSPSGESKTKKVMPVFGLSPDSVAGKGGKEGFRVGNTLLKNPEKDITPPEKVKPYTGPRLTPLALVTRMPAFKKMVKPHYPEKLREMGIEGEVVLDVVIDENGKPVEIKVVRGKYPQFVSAAIESIKNSTFYPAEMHGKPVSVRIRIPIKFRLVE